MLTGLIDVTDGNAWINGLDIRNNINEIRKQIGYCSQNNILFDKLTVRENLYLFGRLKGESKKTINDEIERIIINSGILNSGIENKIISKLSGGEKRKVCLAVALIAGSKIVFLGLILYFNVSDPITS